MMRGRRCGVLMAYGNGYEPDGGVFGCLCVVVLVLIAIGLMCTIGVLTLLGY